MDSDDDGWVHIDPDNPADSSGDDAGILVFSSGCTTPLGASDHEADDVDALALALSSSPSSTRRSIRRARSRSPSPEGVYDPADLEEPPQEPPPPRPTPLSGLFHHTLDGCIDYDAFEPVLCWPDKVLIPGPAFSACCRRRDAADDENGDSGVTVLASNRGLVCLRDRSAAGVYIVANPATWKRVRLPHHSRDHNAYGDPAVVIAFEEEETEPATDGNNAVQDHYYHIVVAFPLGDGIYAYESFSSRTWKWTVGAEVNAVDEVVASSGVGTLGRAFWRTALGYLLCYDPTGAGAASLIPAPQEVLQWPNWELGEMSGTLSVACMDDPVTEVVVINLPRQELQRAADGGRIQWSLAGHFEGGWLRNRNGVMLLRSQGPEVVMWDPALEIVVAMDIEGRTTSTIGPLSGRQYYSDFIPYVSSSTSIITSDILSITKQESKENGSIYYSFTRSSRIEAEAECTFTAADAEE